MSELSLLKPLFSFKSTDAKDPNRKNKNKGNNSSFHHESHTQNGSTHNHQHVHVGKDIHINSGHGGGHAHGGKSKSKGMGKSKSKSKYGGRRDNMDGDDGYNNSNNYNNYDPNNPNNQQQQNPACSPCTRYMLIAMIIMIVLGVAIILIFYGIKAAWLDKGALENCARYNRLGSGLLPIDCSRGQRQYFASTCLLSCPDGYNHTATCTCERGSTDTDCTKWGTSSAPDVCPPGRDLYGSRCYTGCPQGTTRTAMCTCQSGSIKTDCNQFNVASSTPKKCPNGREFIDGLCYKPCPVGSKRTASCTCETGSLDYNCDVYNQESYIPSKCPSGKDYYGLTCVLACPAGYNRTAACTCEYGTSVTECSAFGMQQSYACPTSKQESGGLCYTPCPYNGKRTAACTCYYGDSQWTTTTPSTTCDSAWKYFDGGAQCFYPCGMVSSPSQLNGGASVQATVQCSATSGYPVQGSDSLCWQNYCPNGGSRGGPWTCTYGGVEQSIPATWGCPSNTIPTCGQPSNCQEPNGVVISYTDKCATWSTNSRGVYSWYLAVGIGLPCPSGMVRGVDEKSGCYSPCPVFGGVSGVRLDQQRCRYGSNTGIAPYYQATKQCPWDYPINPPYTAQSGFNFGCYKYSGPLTFIGYNDFNGGSSIAGTLLCPSDKPYRVLTTCYTNGCPTNPEGKPGTREGPVTCSWNCNKSPNPIAPTYNCPGNYPILYDGLCHTVEGTQTSCIAMNGGVGTLPDSCPAGMEDYASACYGKCAPGTSRAGACTCQNKDYITDCTLFGQPSDSPVCDEQSDNFGGICYKNKCPPGKKRTGACTCDDRALITDCAKFADARGPDDPEGPKCEDDEDYFGGFCYKPKCPPGSKRTGACTCDDLKVDTNCTLYGDYKDIGDPLGPKCSGSKDLWGLVCYDQACPNNKARTASCTCDNYSVLTDCDKYGDPKMIGDTAGLGPQCLPGYDWVGGLCYTEPCPPGYTRRDICACVKD